MCNLGWCSEDGRMDVLFGRVEVSPCRRKGALTVGEFSQDRMCEEGDRALRFLERLSCGLSSTSCWPFILRSGTEGLGGCI